MLRAKDIFPLEDNERDEIRGIPPASEKPLVPNELQSPTPEEQQQPDAPGNAVTSPAPQESRATVPSIHATAVVGYLANQVERFMV